MQFDSIDWNKCCTIATVIVGAISLVVAIIALFQSNKQTRLSNKQHLFDRRLSCYYFVHELLQHYYLDRKKLDKEPIYTWMRILLYRLSKCEFLCELPQSRSHALTGKDLELLLTKSKEFKTKAIEVNIVFEGKAAPLISEFLVAYSELLSQIYLFFCLYIGDNPSPLEEDDIDKINAARVEKVLNSLNELYSKALNQKVEERLLEQIKLK